MTQLKKNSFNMRDTSFYSFRKAMVENQLRANKVSNKLISDAFLIKSFRRHHLYQ